MTVVLNTGMLCSWEEYIPRMYLLQKWAVLSLMWCHCRRCEKSNYYVYYYTNSPLHFEHKACSEVFDIGNEDLQITDNDYAFSLADIFMILWLWSSFE